MVKGFIEQSHGSIDVSSILGQGTLITIELPIAQHADATPPPPPKLQRDGTTSLNDLHILLVEDNELVQRVTKRLLTRWGAHVTIAHSGDEALPLIASQRFDLIITDMIMPGRASGADVVRFAQHHHPDLPILITTGYASSDLLDEHGLQQTKRLLLLGKPHDASTLEQHLLQLLS
jgi:CheY-like chemotaxis protein